MSNDLTNNEKSYNKPNGKLIGEGKVVAIHAMKSMGIGNEEIAKRVKVSRTTVHFISQSEIYNPAIIERIKKYAASRFWITQWNALEAITPEKLETSSAKDLSLIAAISTDKARLIEGESTVNVGFIDKKDADLEREIQELELELARSLAIDATVLNPMSEMASSSPVEPDTVSPVLNDVIPDNPEKQNPPLGTPIE